MPDFESLYQTGPAVAMVRSPDQPWHILSISPNISRFGITPPDGEFDLTLFIDGSDVDIVSRKLGAAIMQKRPFVTMRYRIQKDDIKHWVEDYCTLTYNADGTAAGIGSLLWLTTLPLEWHILSNASHSWNDLNSKIRHDILNQLTAILGYLELSEDLVSDPMLKDFNKKEQNAAERIREKLIFTREYQKIGLTEAEWVKLPSLIVEAIGEAGCKNLTIDIDIPEIRFFVDKTFKQALIRILENTPEHAPGATAIKIFFTCVNGDGNLVIEDNGPGIEVANKVRIFDISFGSGEGYGLFLAEKLLGVFGMAIRETGTAGNNARFEIIIPKELIQVL
jgi:hypothetical protein